MTSTMPREYHFVNTFQPGDAYTLENRTQVRSCAALSGYNTMFETVPCGRKWRSRRAGKFGKQNKREVFQSKIKTNRSVDAAARRDSASAQHGRNFNAPYHSDQFLDEVQPVPADLFGGPHDDPFWMYPCPKLSFMPAIIHHYTTYMTPALAQLDKSQASGLLHRLNRSLIEPALFYALATFAGTHLSARGDKAVAQVDLLWLKWKAVSTINEALRDESRSTSDLLIQAVFSMANLERIYGDVESYHSHLTGLKRMIAIRGGLQNIDPNDAQTIQFLDRAAKLFTGSQLHFSDQTSDETSSPPPVEIPIETGTNLLPTPPDSPSMISLPIGFSNIQVTSELLVALSHLHTTVDFLQGQHRQTIPVEDISDMREKLAIVESHILVSAPAISSFLVENSDQDHSAETIAQCIRYAALSLTHHILTAYDTSSIRFQHHPLISKAASKLCFEPSTIDRYGAEVIWTLFMVGMADTGPAKARIRKLLAQMVQQLQLTTWDEAQALLRTFLYLPDICDEPCKELWWQAMTISAEELELDDTEESAEEHVWVSWVPLIDPTDTRTMAEK